MDYSCDFCPPSHFANHDKCHNAILVFLNRYDNIKAECENLRPELLFKLSKWIDTLAVICETSNTEEEYEQYYNGLTHFNIIVNRILEQRKNRLPTQNNNTF